MPTATYTHVTLAVDDLDESVAFYGDAFGMGRIPTPDWDLPVQWLACGGLQLHLVETEAEAPAFHHFGVHVDDVEAVYEAVAAHPDATFDDLGVTEDGDWADGDPPVYALPEIGTLQLYVRDPSGNMVEVDAPDVDALDRDVAPNVVERTDLDAPDPDSDANLYGPFGLDPKNPFRD
ncbi:catechol 2,3-dioxygenase-like lactoylglutathione lyase family enzyme [Halarchaeum rubridurum]|uniref:Catechol 2,3-dioxygenase-like lactoylglutathione lyase family enzyme n=1 Tax=Halarchaeum rubridurum TaxID=489911 RepID=A0A830FXG4_9EURY|nr:VOC family protein [Halarchaeum rubridurum]MBP1954781.1 catechol 2,3-dioxygenase-like lactoylglutathione lyase family enzyme [Halarchaeum rubridurum]GGM59701.1 hypothetical protein GCM10009017_07310 [Halarchaeum rubridurum]